jgi:ABC-type uncharacterized transport system substrate-binding protein
MLNRCALSLTSALLVCGAFTLPAQAHPHVWITTETTVLYERGSFVGLRHTWTFDEFYTAMAIEGLDKNKDGKYDREELGKLAEVNIEGLKEFGYFTTAGLAGQELKFAEAEDYWLEHKEDVLSLHFTIRFEHPVSEQAKGLTFAIGDPTYFIAFQPAKVGAAKLDKGAPTACNVHEKKQEEDQLRRDALQRQFGAFAGTSKDVFAIECGAQ